MNIPILVGAGGYGHPHLTCPKGQETQQFLTFSSRQQDLVSCYSDLLFLFPSVACYPPSSYFAFFPPFFLSSYSPCLAFLHVTHLHHLSLFNQFLLIFLSSLHF